MTIHFTNRKGPRQDKIEALAKLERLCWHENKGVDQVAKELGWTREKTVRWINDNGIVGYDKPYKVPNGGGFDFTLDNVETGRL